MTTLTPTKDGPKFDAIEIGYCAEFSDTDGVTFMDRLDTPDEVETAKEEAIGYVYTVYGHYAAQRGADGWYRVPDPDQPYGVVALGDFLTYEAACEIAVVLARTAGLEIEDYVPRDEENEEVE